MIRNFLSAILPLVVTALLGGCVSPSPVAFRVTDAQGDPVAGAHVRILLMEAGAQIPVSGDTLEETAMLASAGGGFSDRSGRVVLPVIGGRVHMIEIEGPVLGAADPMDAPVAVWFYRPSDRSLVGHGQGEQALRVDRVE